MLKLTSVALFISLSVPPRTRSMASMAFDSFLHYIRVSLLAIHT